jgi:hypothetical protein
VKIIMRGAVTLAPAQGLATGAAAVQQLLASCASPGTSPAARHSHMEAAVLLLECLAQPLADGPAAQQPALADGLAALLQQMLALRVNDAVCITLVGGRGGAGREGERGWGDGGDGGEWYLRRTGGCTSPHLTSAGVISTA